MACNSVATTSTQITKVVLAKEDLVNLLAKTVGVDASKIGYNGNSSTWHRVYCYTGDVTYIVDQEIDGKTVNLEFSASDRTGELTQAQLDAKIAPVKEQFSSQTIKAQQTSVLRRLAQLGKLSNVQGKQSGVVARLEITI